ncbi:MAG: hypothetical protein EBT92_18645 [Planctomycetes bacterium]|nr:hypothetical protein [Planctomycetota bacterium]
MEMKQQHYAILKRLHHGASSLKRFTDKDAEVGNQGFHYLRYLNDLQNFGYALEIGDVWHITGFGVAKLAEQKPRVAKDRVAAGTTTETYDGADLKHGGNRVGASDFLKYPSKFGDNLTFPRTSV